MPISVQAFRDECSAPLRLRLLAGERGMDRGIAGSRVQEAGLAIAGEVLPSREGCVQVLGETEVDYFRRQDPARQPEIAERFFAGPLPCAVVVGPLPAPGLFVEAAERASVPCSSPTFPRPDFSKRRAASFTGFSRKPPRSTASSSKSSVWGFSSRDEAGSGKANAPSTSSSVATGSWPTT